MICNKKEWEILDNVQHVLLNYYRTNTLKESEIKKNKRFHLFMLGSNEQTTRA